MDIWVEQQPPVQHAHTHNHQQQHLPLLPCLGCTLRACTATEVSTQRPVQIHQLWSSCKQQQSHAAALCLCGAAASAHLMPLCLNRWTATLTVTVQADCAAWYMPRLAEIWLRVK